MYKQASLLILLLSLRAGAQTTAPGLAMITCFSQAKATSAEAGANCASIAVIKLAMRKYGVHNLFTKNDLTDQTYHVTLRNGNEVVVTQQDLVEAKKYSLFEPRVPASGAVSDTVEAAQFAYAVMAKRYQIENKLPTITEAVYHDRRHYIEDDVAPNAGLLGVPVTERLLGKRENITELHDVIVTSFYHAAYGDAGRYDEYGTPTTYGSFLPLHAGQNALNSTLGKLVRWRTRISTLYTM